jgi:enamine deaminase RidA (YjgF/YER057c/UK114 family)
LTPPADSSRAALTALRQPLPRWPDAGAAAVPQPPLHADGVQLGGPGTPPAALPELVSAGERSDCWCVQPAPGSAQAAAEGHCGAVAWRTCGGWLHGTLDLPDDGRDLQALSRRAYGDVFATLRDTGMPHLQRVWNYLPRIHAENLGLERYRQFNAGRQQAFIDAGHDTFEGAPAACALGSHDGVLRIRFLAGRQAPLPVENPRQVSAYRYPSAYGPKSPTFSRAALASVGVGRVALFVSGTASIVGHASLHPGDVRAQVQETLRNLRAVLQAASQRSGGLPFDLRQMAATVYVRHPCDLAAVQHELAAALGADAPLCTHALWLQADVCRSDLLVEIEGHLFVDGSLPAAGAAA